MKHTKIIATGVAFALLASSAATFANYEDGEKGSMVKGGEYNIFTDLDLADDLVEGLEEIRAEYQEEVDELKSENDIESLDEDEKEAFKAELNAIFTQMQEAMVDYLEDNNQDEAADELEEKFENKAEHSGEKKGKKGERGEHSGEGKDFFGDLDLSDDIIEGLSEIKAEFQEEIDELKAGKDFKDLDEDEKETFKAELNAIYGEMQDAMVDYLEANNEDEAAKSLEAKFEARAENSDTEKGSYRKGTEKGEGSERKGEKGEKGEKFERGEGVSKKSGERAEKANGNSDERASKRSSYKSAFSSRLGGVLTTLSDTQLDSILDIISVKIEDTTNDDMIDQLEALYEIIEETIGS